MPAPRHFPRHLLAAALILAVVLVGLAAPATAHGTRWRCLAHSESGHRWHINSGNGHYGGLQFTRSTWRYYGGRALTGKVYPHRASRKNQIRIGRRTAWYGWRDHQAQGGRNAWPNTWGRCF